MHELLGSNGTRTSRHDNGLLLPHLTLLRLQGPRHLQTSMSTTRAQLSCTSAGSYSLEAQLCHLHELLAQHRQGSNLFTPRHRISLQSESCRSAIDFTLLVQDPTRWRPSCATCTSCWAAMASAPPSVPPKPCRACQTPTGWLPGSVLGVGHLQISDRGRKLDQMGTGSPPTGQMQVIIYLPPFPSYQVLACCVLLAPHCFAPWLGLYVQCVYIKVSVALLLLLLYDDAGIPVSIGSFTTTMAGAAQLCGHDSVRVKLAVPSSPHGCWTCACGQHGAALQPLSARQVRCTRTGRHCQAHCHTGISLPAHLMPWPQHSLPWSRQQLQIVDANDEPREAAAWLQG